MPRAVLPLCCVLLSLSPSIAGAADPVPLAADYAEAKQIQARLRQVAAEDIDNRWVTYTAPQVEIRNGDRGYGMYYTWGGVDLPESLLDNDDIPLPAVLAQYNVELIRKTRTAPNQQAHWKPYLARIETEIVGDLAKWRAAKRVPPKKANGDVLDFSSVPEFGRDYYYEEFTAAMDAAAASIRLKAFPPYPGAPRPGFDVITRTPANIAAIELIPATEWRIAKTLGAQAEFRSLSTGAEARLLGWYFYRSVDKAGNRSTDLKKVKIERDGPFDFN